MQGHGGDDVGLGEQFRPGTGQPAAKSGGGFGAVAMLETQDHAPAGVVIDQHCAGPLIDRRAADAGGAQHPRPGIIFKGCAAARTGGRTQERHRVPAGRAETTGLIHHPAASQAMGRKNDVQQPPPGRPQPGGERAAAV